MTYRQLAESGCANEPPPALSAPGGPESSLLALVESELLSSPAVVVSVVSSVAAVVSSVLVAGVVSAVTGAEMTVVVVVVVVACELSSAWAIPGSPRANAAASAAMAGTIQPWRRGRGGEVMAFRSLDEGSIHDLQAGRSPSSGDDVGKRAESLRPTAGFP
jgi:hypothetical protein